MSRLIFGDYMAGTYQLKKKAIGGYVVTYDCPNCAAGLTSPLDEAGSSQNCPTCNMPFVVPGKAECDQLRAKIEQERKTRAEAKLQQERELAKQRKIAEEEARRQQAEQQAQEQKRREYIDSHCPYCREEIKAGVKKCKHCHEYLDPSLRAKIDEQDVVRFRPPLDDVFWLVVKFWVASLLLGLVGWLIVIAFLAILASAT